jgi:hypothetical protein
MKKFTLWLLLFSTLALGASGDRYIQNPNQDKDIIFQVNKGGTKTDAFIISGTSGGIVSGFANVRGSEGAGTTTLTKDDNRHQIYNLSAARTNVMPTTGIKAGDKWLIENRTSFLLTIQASGGQEINSTNSANANASIAAGYALLMSLQDTPTTAAHWRVVDVYETGSFSGTWTFGGSGGTSSSRTNLFTRNGRQVSIYVQDFSATTGTSANVATTAANMPARLVPGTNNNACVYTDYRSNGTLQSSLLVVCVNGDGSFGAYRQDQANFPNTTANTGFGNFINYAAIHYRLP